MHIYYSKIYDILQSMKGKHLDAPEYSSLHQPINNQDSQSSWQSLFFTWRTEDWEGTWPNIQHLVLPKSAYFTNWDVVSTLKLDQAGPWHPSLEARGDGLNTITLRYSHILQMVQSVS